MREHPRLTFILAGRSGSGKSTMADILESELGLHRCVTSTTRPIRDGEIPGVTYHFLKEMDRSKMFESAPFGEHWYGASLEELEKSDFIILEPKGIEYYRKNFPSPLVVIQLERNGIDVSQERMDRDRNGGFDSIHPDYIVRGDTIQEMSSNLIALVNSIMPERRLSLPELIASAEQRKQIPPFQKESRDKEPVHI